MIRKMNVMTCMVLLLFSAGCASVEIKRVSPNDFTTTGMRFYRPRPYLLVHEPFVVDSRTILARGQLTLDAQYVLVGDLKSDSTEVKDLIGNHMAFDTGERASIPAGRVLMTNQPPAARPGGEQAEVVTEPKPEAKDGDQKPEAGKPPAKEPGKDSGVLAYKVANDNSSFAVMPLKRYFDVVMLPDFDEEYVVNAKAGLGNASVGLTLGQGWSLQGVDTAVDNSALVGPILGLIRTGMDAAETLARAHLGLPPAVSGAGEQAAVVTPRAETLPGGTPLSIKITLVRVVSPGLYPLLKPKELSCLTLKAPTDGSCKTDYKEFEKSYILPVPPLTAYALKTYELLIVEAAKASGDSITNIQRYFDAPSSSVAGGGAAPSSAPGMTELEQKCQKALPESNKGLKQPEPYWRVDSLAPSRDGKTIIAIVRPQPRGGEPTKPREEVNRVISDALAKAGVNMSAVALRVDFQVGTP